MIYIILFEKCILEHATKSFLSYTVYTCTQAKMNLFFWTHTCINSIRKIKINEIITIYRQKMEEDRQEIHRPSLWQIEVGRRLKKLSLGWEELKLVGPFPFGFLVYDRREAPPLHRLDLSLDL